MSKILLKIYRLAQMGSSYKLKLVKPLGPPYQFSIEATNRCNFKCAFCPQSRPDHKNVRAVGSLSLENFRLFVKKIKEINPGNSNLSICLDGEPLMNKNFPDFIRLANDEGLFPRFSSNGRLFSQKIIDELSGLKFLAAVDFSSEEKVFDTTRGNSGDYKIVLNNLKNLVDKATKNPGIKLEIVDTTHFDKNYAPTDSLRKMVELFPSNLPPNIKFWSRQFHNFGGHIQNEQGAKTRYKLCPYPWTSFSVTWDGNVVACCRDTEGKTILGNVFEQSIKEIWRGERYVEMRKALIEKRVQDVTACEKCDMPYSASNERWKIKYILSSLLRR